MHIHKAPIKEIHARALPVREMVRLGMVVRRELVIMKVLAVEADWMPAWCRKGGLLRMMTGVPTRQKMWRIGT